MTEQADYIVIMTTHESQEKAAGIAKTLVGEQLVACAQLMPVTSYFTWESAVDQADEVLLLLKTRSALYERVESRIGELHSYDVPEVLKVPVLGGLASYTEWMNEVTLAD